MQRCTSRLTARTKGSICAVRIEARWRSGDVEDCKSSHPGSIPGRASNRCIIIGMSVDRPRSARTSSNTSNSVRVVARRAAARPETARSRKGNNSCEPRSNACVRSWGRTPDDRLCDTFDTRSSVYFRTRSMRRRSAETVPFQYAVRSDQRVEQTDQWTIRGRHRQRVHRARPHPAKCRRLQRARDAGPFSGDV